jgi:hypothetical protein
MYLQVFPWDRRLLRRLLLLVSGCKRFICTEELIIAFVLVDCLSLSFVSPFRMFVHGLTGGKWTKPGSIESAS